MENKYFLDLSETPAERVFIVGEVNGDFDKFIGFLYEQSFNFKDILVLTGNCVNVAEPRKSSECIDFVMENDNCYSVRGYQENLYIKYSQNEELMDKIHADLRKNLTRPMIEFIKNLPLIIKVMDYYYIVHAGIEPFADILTQDPDVYYSIGEYDENSRFYQFQNPDKKNWYEYEFSQDEQPIKIVYSALPPLGKHTVPAGYCLGRKHKILDPLTCMILSKNSEPIIIEVR